MTDMQALYWVDQHLFYTLNWFESNPDRGDLHHWDYVVIEWPEGSRDVILRAELVTYVTDNFDPF